MKPYAILSFFACILLFNSCSSDTENANIPTSKTELITSLAENADDDVFSNIDEVRKKLTSVGIGQLTEWKDDGMGGYMSITNYYSLEGSGNGLPNNMAYYLESSKRDRIESIKLVLNINEASYKTLALEKFKEVSLETFQKLGLEVPKGLDNALSKVKIYKGSTAKINVSITLEKSRIDTWMLTIKPKS